MITYNLQEIYFSAPNSFLCMKASDDHDRIIYSTTAREAMSEKWMPFWAANFFAIVLLVDGQEISYSWSAYPHRLDLLAGTQQQVSFAFTDSQSLIFEAHGVDVRFLPLKPYKSCYTTPDGVHNIVDTGTQYIHQFTPGIHTRLHTSEVGTVEFLHMGERNSRGAFRLVRHESFWTEQPEIHVERAARSYATQFQSWLERMPSVPKKYQASAEKALFLLWNCQVPQGNILTRRTIFSSKASMNSIWSWDNCFHALAVAEVDPQLAWDQLLLLFDHQAANGVLPDVISDDKIFYGYTKPPIYGWTIRKLIDLLGVEASLPYMSQLYQPLCRLTEWWYRQRGSTSGMCCYYDGNDSGWDNATIFDMGVPIEGVDLAAYLVLQLETLSDMANLLGYTEAAQTWQQKAHQQIATLLSVGIQNSRFLARTRDNHQPVSPYSLLNVMPLVLGKRLPADIISHLKSDIQPGGPFLTDFGLASESLASPAYTADGYWRGPIWAPPTYLIVDGLHDAGETDLARLIAQRYCDMITTNPGFYENYDALSGKGLRCPGICWTAAVFLRLAAWLNIA